MCISPYPAVEIFAIVIFYDKHVFIIYVYCFVLSTESPLSTTKQVCGKLGKLGTNVVPAHIVFELARNNREVHSNINGISDLFPGLSLSSMYLLQSFVFASSCYHFAIFIS